MKQRRCGSSAALVVALALFLTASFVSAESSERDGGAGNAQEGRLWVVDRNHPDAADPEPMDAEGMDSQEEDVPTDLGTVEQPFRTIGAAADRARAGDTVRVHAGVYRERVAPARGGEPGNPVVYEAAAGERVVVRGSDILEVEWEEVAPGVFVATMPGAYLTAENPLMVPQNGGGAIGSRSQLFVDGRKIAEVDSRDEVRRTPGSWAVYRVRGQIWFHPPGDMDDPEDHLLEVTVRERVFAPYTRGLGYITVRGFVFEHGANYYPSSFWSSTYPQAGIVGCRGGNHWVIENNTIRHAATIGLDCGSEGDQDADGLEQAEPDDAGHHLIRGNTISDNGAAGIVAYRSTGTRIIGNIIERNNSEGFYSYESGGIKNHFFIDGVIEGNLVRDNDAVGIWLDNTNHRSRVSRNVVLRNRGAGIFLEMTFGPILVDNNVVALTVPTHNMAGDGIYAHDASEVTLMHNLILANANYGVWAHIATNRRARHPELGMTEVGASDWRIQNNIIAGNHRGALSMPMESPRSRNNRSDFNVFAGGFDPLRGAQPSVPNAPARFGLNSNGGRTPIPAGAAPAMLEARLTLDEWREITQQDEHSRDGIVLNANMNVAQPRLRLTVDRADLGADMPGHPEITHDLLGRPWTAENRKAGPLTALVEVPRLSDEAERGRSVRGVRRNEVNYLPLWPLPGVSTD